MPKLSIKFIVQLFCFLLVCVGIVELADFLTKYAEMNQLEVVFTGTAVATVLVVLAMCYAKKLHHDIEENDDERN